MTLSRIAIVGVGLMGGSLAAACRRKFTRARVVGISRDKSALRFALRRRWIHEARTNLRDGVKSAGLIVLCTPVDTLARYLKDCGRFARPGAVVTDVGSVKGAVARFAAARKFKRISFIGAHPMTGSHARGIQAASPGLYESSLCFIVPPRKEKARAYALARSFWKKICGRVVEISAEAHDRAAAQISHLPHALAVCLMRSVEKKSLRFAACGFRDVTRIAQGDPSIWLPIFMANRREIQKALAQFENSLRKFRGALGARNASALRRMLADAAQSRRQISL